jgi:hypothetical protein
MLHWFDNYLLIYGGARDMNFGYVFHVSTQTYYMLALQPSPAGPMYNMMVKINSILCQNLLEINTSSVNSLLDTFRLLTTYSTSESPIPGVVLFGGIDLTESTVLPLNVSYLRLCDVGTAGRNGICSYCPAGTFKHSLMAGCSPCPAGSYSSLVGVTQCAGLCQPGFYGDDTAQTQPNSCLPCPAGTFMLPTVYGASGVHNCSLCPIGTFNEVRLYKLFVSL